jgi:ARG and Rhodanese-Phosphatase-superfamily-associated Protein domain
MPTLNEVPEVAQLLATILTGEPVTHGALTVVPPLAPNLDDPDWLTLEEAGDRARVTEVSEAGSVPFLRVANGADRPLLLLDGEELIGAKQNRILRGPGSIAQRFPLMCSSSRAPNELGHRWRKPQKPGTCQIWPSRAS